MEFLTELKTAWPKGPNSIITLFKTRLADVQQAEQVLFIDRFWHSALQLMQSEPPNGSIWFIALRWYEAMGIADKSKVLTTEELKRRREFLIDLRRELIRSLLHEPLQLPVLPEKSARSAILMWRDLFLSSQAILNQPQSEVDFLTQAPLNLHENPTEGYYRWMLSQSLRQPFSAEQYPVDVEAMLSAQIPLFAKIILVMWLVNISRYNATQYQRQRAQLVLPDIFRFSSKQPVWLDPFFHILAEWLMITMFRLAYIHDDNSSLTRLFGEFIQHQMNRFLPQYAKPLPSTNRQDYSRKIRVGYVSGRMVTNAVTFYMANRIFRYDADSFEIHLFAMGEKQDDMTRLLHEKADRFTLLPNPMDYPTIAQKIIESQLDILVFTDIGMDIHSYLLAGLRLAPIQVALLGHASPTGLPTIDYFVSSEAEPNDAEKCYRERLVKLPGAGADQIRPPGLKGFRDSGLSRARLAIPDSAFVFISCANGMKHVPERDFLWLEILRMIPHAYIVLKPFSPGDSDVRLRDRIRQVGLMAGAPERIRCVESCDSHQEVMSLLSLSDVQLDTYPFNGWTTTIEAICMGLPTITQEGKAYRSRLGAAFLRSLGISEGIAANAREYLAWAVRLANDPALCCWIRSRIKATCQVTLFENHAVQIAYENALLAMAREQKGAER